MERHSPSASSSSIGRYGGPGLQQAVSQPKPVPEIRAPQNPVQGFCTPEHREATAKALGGFLGDKHDADWRDVNSHAQAEKLFLWRGASGDSRCVNAAWRGASSQARQAFIQQMATLYPVVKPDLREPPTIIVVPAGLHSLNLVRVRALQDLLEQVRERFGDEALAKLQIYFPGGRDLLEQEYQPVDQVMDAGLNVFCEAQWSQLTQDQKNQFLAHFGDAQAAELGPSGLQLTKPQSGKLREKDSMKQIWTQAPELAPWRKLIGRDQVHFHEAPPQARVQGKDNTHGNARLVLDKCLAHGTLDPQKKQIVAVCSDPYCLVRVEQTFVGYFEPWGWTVLGCSASMTGTDPALVAESNEAFAVLGLREAACNLNEQREAEKDPSQWFNCEDLKKKYALPQ
jgi:hypothetical protein